MNSTEQVVLLIFVVLFIMVLVYMGISSRKTRAFCQRRGGGRGGRGLGGGGGRGLGGGGGRGLGGGGGRGLGGGGSRGRSRGRVLRGVDTLERRRVPQALRTVVKRTPVNKRLQDLGAVGRVEVVKKDKVAGFVEKAKEKVKEAVKGGKKVVKKVVKKVLGKKKGKKSKSKKKVLPKKKKKVPKKKKKVPKKKKAPKKKKKGGKKKKHHHHHHGWWRSLWRYDLYPRCWGPGWGWNNGIYGSLGNYYNFTPWLCPNYYPIEPQDQVCAWYGKYGRLEGAYYTSNVNGCFGTACSSDRVTDCHMHYNRYNPTENGQLQYPSEYALGPNRTSSQCIGNQVGLPDDMICTPTPNLTNCEDNVTTPEACKNSAPRIPMQNPPKKVKEHANLCLQYCCGDKCENTQ